jgi:large subunit ribosomal protein L21
MYAVISSGGKQYRVSKDDVIQLETLDANEGDVIRFENVLLVADGENIQVGMPYLKGAAVSAEVLNFGRGKKIEVLKFKRRKHHMKRMGHRQNFIEVKIKDITS